MRKLLTVGVCVICIVFQSISFAQDVDKHFIR